YHLSAAHCLSSSRPCSRSPSCACTLSLHDALPICDELVYQRRYGLLFEGHRWIDMRRWGLLDQLPKDREGDGVAASFPIPVNERSEEHTSELQSRENLVCRLLLEKKKTRLNHRHTG